MIDFSRVALPFLVICFTASLDQATKIIVRTQIEFGENINIIPGFFSLTHLRNPGAAFGFLGGIDPTVRTGFFLVVYALVAFFAVSRIRVTTSKLEIAAFSLLVGGAIGNAICRFKNGFVTDFLDFYFASFHYPAFNVADISICAGIALLLFQEFFEKKLKCTVAH